MGSASFSPSVCYPSTLRMVIWPDAISAQNSIGSVKNLGRYAASWIAWLPNRPSSTAALT